MSVGKCLPFIEGRSVALVMFGMNSYNGFVCDFILCITGMLQVVVYMQIQMFTLNSTVLYCNEA